MDPSEINNFENQWKKAFDEASETPPPSVWEDIEARLDHDENDIVPLWWRTPKLWYAAASIIALLVVGGGYFVNNSSETGSGVLKEMAEKSPESEKADNDLTKDTPRSSEDIKKQKVEGKESFPERAPVKHEGSLAGSKQKKPKENHFDITAETSSAWAARAGHVGNSKNDVGSTANESFSETASAFDRKEVNSITDIPQASLLAQAAQSGLELETLEGIGVTELDVFIQKRYVFYKQDSPEEEKLPEPKQKGEYWAGIGLMPASFNPDVQIRQTAPSFYSAQNLNSLQSSGQRGTTGTSKAGNSYAVQTQGGMKISKHWSLEMGVNYLRANSSYEGGGYVLNTSSARSANMLEDALVNLSTSTSKAFPDNYPVSPGQGGGEAYEGLSGNAFIDVNRNVSNNYQYLQLPLQAGFTLRPDKKLSYSLLGGMMANFFLSNELESAAGQMIRTTASDEVYRSMNWAATTGLRLNYKVSSRWKTTLMGSYQKAVSSGVRANQSLESHPYLYGVSWGMRYSF